ncbi:hypothetical protein [Bacteroides heparinolyticus]|uniref:hypothetical protein n=1 Tax=Prevotella heparinolytica TaxID=28113 RepID=UPI0035A09D48
MKGVITGDIINSAAIPIEQRTKLLQQLDGMIKDLAVLSPLQYEVFRGDSFQVIVDKAESALSIGVLIRAGLRKSTPKDAEAIWDARIAIGVGDVEFMARHVVASDGEAFQYSGRAFDELGKRNLIVRTRWENVNEELKVSTLFADDIISNWTPTQSFVVYQSLAFQKTQKEIAMQQRQSAQNISKISMLAKEKLIRSYIGRYRYLITLNEP